MIKTLNHKMDVQNAHSMELPVSKFIFVQTCPNYLVPHLQHNALMPQTARLVWEFIVQTVYNVVPYMQQQLHLCCAINLDDSCLQAKGAIAK